MKTKMTEDRKSLISTKKQLAESEGSRVIPEKNLADMTNYMSDLELRLQVMKARILTWCNQDIAMSLFQEAVKISFTN